ncbi:hypothetical protein Q9233_006305 [Columba guinea]|nr:hypothetical protein Q9233_006305 [Columba guinea]
MATGKDALLLSLVLTVGVTALVATGHNAEQPEVETKYGRVRGYRFKVDAAERSVNVFLGLPFAKPPVGPLRFSEPQPPEPWKGVRDATSYPPMCLQDKEKGNLISYLVTNRKEKVYLQVSEDCLYLNVYTPVATEKQELPVFVWIHGGGLICGAGSTYDGSALAAFDNVVVVTIQYRLGILGYFSTGDKHAPGNWGYLDQVAALQWIQENIRYFGGDPGSVTIVGESAGGISVSALTTIYAFTSADGVFFPKRPVQLLFEKLINPVPYIIGVNNCEFGWVMPTSLKIPASADGLDEDVARQHLQGLLAMNIKGVTSEVVDRVYNEYIGNAANRIQVRDGFLDAVADAWFVFPSIEVARYHRDAGNPVYFYEFQHRPSSATGVVPEFVKADHGAEVAFVFGKPFLAGQNGAEPEVTIALGQLKGRQTVVKETDRLVNVFLGIPFAKAPVGPLRFSPPEPPEPWNELRDATSYPPICPQDLSLLKIAEKNFKEKHIPFRTSEDCLYLNVYSPAGSNKNKLPVMVWIHGGNFIFGGASRYDGSALAAYENIVVVLIQYRLGLLGFFNTGDEHARGNWGFLDQVAALHWVQENIERFGGDPGSVTLFGASAGSCSVFAHILSPMSKGLFHKAILESGIIIPPDKALHLTTDLKRIASIFKCEMSSSLSLINCLRNQEANHIVLNSTDITFLPLVLDGVFLHKSPEEILAGKEFNVVPFMIGVTNNEFGWNMRSTSRIPGLKEIGDKKSIISTLEFFLPLIDLPPEFLPVIVDEYLGNTDDPAELRDGFLELLGDLGIVIPSIRALNYYRESGAPTYFFEYQHRPISYRDSKPAYVKADHGDEVGFVFGGPFLAGDIQLRSEVTEEEKNLSRTLMKYWANFARNGNPNGEGLVEWPSYNLNEEYLQINLKQKKASKLKEKKVDFWRKVMFEKTNSKRTENKKVNSEL